MEAQIPDGTVEELDKEAVEEPRVSNPPFCHLCPFLRKDKAPVDGRCPHSQCQRVCLLECFRDPAPRD